MFKRLLFIASTAFILPLAGPPGVADARQINTFILPHAGLPGVADAREINTPIIQAENRLGLFYKCWVTNLDKRNITDVTIDLIDEEGTVFHTRSGQTVEAGQSLPLSIRIEFSASARCRVSGKFSKKKVIVNLTLNDTTGDILNGNTVLSVTGR